MTKKEWRRLTNFLLNNPVEKNRTQFSLWIITQQPFIYWHSSSTPMSFISLSNNYNAELYTRDDWLHFPSDYENHPRNINSNKIEKIHYRHIKSIRLSIGRWGTFTYKEF